MRATLIVLSLFAAAPAAAQEMELSRIAGSPTLDLVQATCFAQAADTQSISADLSARGWRQIDDAERRQRDPENVGAGFIMHWATSQAWAPLDDPSITLVLGEGPLGGGAARADFCMIVDDVPFSRQTGAVRQWLGFPRFQTWGPGGDNFAYISDSEGRISNGAQAAEADANIAVSEGRFGFIQVVGDRAASVINVSVVHSTTPQGAGPD